MSPKILYENNNILVINKPSGLVVHSDGKTQEPTLCDWLLKQYPEIAGVGEPLTLQNGSIIDRPGIVHRLDRDTSGVMVVTKTQEAHSHLKKQFKGREVKKIYHAFVYGNIKEDSGIIDKPIGRSPKDFRQWSALANARGELREAQTIFRVLGRTKIDGESVTYVELEPKTGRTHQIRVHMKAIGNPLVCDSLYAANRPCLISLERTALHARLISFKNMDGDEVSVEADFPDDLKELIKVVDSKQ